MTIPAGPEGSARGRNVISRRVRDPREGRLPGSADGTPPYETCWSNSSPTCPGAGLPWRAAGLGGLHTCDGSPIPQGGYQGLSFRAEVTTPNTGGKTSLSQRNHWVYLPCPLYKQGNRLREENATWSERSPRLSLLTPSVLI